MIRIDRLCIMLFIVSFAFLLPSAKYVKFIDELCSFGLLALALADCVVNRAWRRYRLLGIIVGVITFYAVYSLLFVHYNTPRAIAVDWVIQLKPFIPFVVMQAVRPALTSTDRLLLKVLAVANVVVVAVLLACGGYWVRLVIFHPLYAGIGVFVSAMVYLYCSIDSEGRVSPQALGVVLVLLAVGLGCTRAKYYGEFVLALFYLLLYRPGMTRNWNMRHLSIIMATVLLTVAVGWNKFEYYFITGGSGGFDPNVIESYARPVLYATSALIMWQHLPFGSGLASFASYASAEYYSSLYYRYGLDKIHGLSEAMPDFICDAFYPSLAQFGVAGVVLFIIFWVYVYRRLARYVRFNPSHARYTFATGMLLMWFIFIESIASTAFVQAPGMVVMMLIGVICGTAPQCESADAAVSLPQPDGQSQKQRHIII